MSVRSWARRPPSDSQNPRASTATNGVFGPGLWGFRANGQERETVAVRIRVDVAVTATGPKVRSLRTGVVRVLQRRGRNRPVCDSLAPEWALGSDPAPKPNSARLSATAHRPVELSASRQLSKSRPGARCCDAVARARTSAVPVRSLCGAVRVTDIEVTDAPLPATGYAGDADAY